MITHMTPLMANTLRLPSKPHVSWLARFGYFARALVYFMMGGLALLVVAGSRSGKTTDSKGTLRELLSQPFGRFFLIVIALGLLSYAIWRMYQAIKDTEHLGSKGKGLLKRVGYAIGGVIAASLASYAGRLAFSLAPSGGSEKTLAHKLLVLPFGQALTLAVGVGIIGFGLSQFVVAIKEKFLKHLAIPADKRRAVIPICKFGLMARGAVFSLIGIFFVRAAIHFNSHEAGGISKAWEVLRSQAYGGFLVAIVAAGFIAFGVYGVLESMYSDAPSS